MTTSDRPVTVRLDAELLSKLMGLCIIDDTKLADQMRRGLNEYVVTRQQNRDFAEQIDAARSRQSAALDALAQERATQAS